MYIGLRVGVYRVRYRKLKAPQAPMADGGKKTRITPYVSLAHTTICTKSAIHHSPAHTITSTASLVSYRITPVWTLCRSWPTRSCSCPIGFGGCTSRDPSRTLSRHHCRVACVGCGFWGDAEQIQRSMHLLQQDASIIVGTLAPQAALALATQCQSAEIPFISLANRKDIAQIGSWIFGLPLTLQQQVDALVRWSIHEKGLRRFAILYPNNRYGQNALQALKGAVQQHEQASSCEQDSLSEQTSPQEKQAVIAQSYEPEETTFTLPVRQLLGLPPY